MSCGFIGAQNHGTDLVSPMIFYPYGADVVQLYGSDLLSPLLAYLADFACIDVQSWVLFLVIGGLGYAA